MKISERIEQLKALARIYAKAKADETYLTHFRKSKLAILKKSYSLDNPGWSNAKCEDYARANDDYIEILKGLKEATETSSAALWELKISHAGISIYQTQRADRRAEIKSFEG